jgi:hypothetical protein
MFDTLRKLKTVTLCSVYMNDDYHNKCWLFTILEPLQAVSQSYVNIRGPVYKKEKCCEEQEELLSVFSKSLSNFDIKKEVTKR